MRNKIDKEAIYQATRNAALGAFSDHNLLEGSLGKANTAKEIARKLTDRLIDQSLGIFDVTELTPEQALEECRASLSRSYRGDMVRSQMEELEQAVPALFEAVKTAYQPYDAQIQAVLSANARINRGGPGAGGIDM